MTTIWNDLLNLLFPNLCLLCKEKLIESEKQICLHCLYKLPHVDLKQLPNPVLDLFTGKVTIEYANAFLHYEKGSTVQTIIHSFKYQDNKELAFLMGRQFGLALKELPTYTNTTVLIPVPLHKKRQKQRGYNQSEWIGKGIASVLGTPIDTSTLIRTNQSDTQTSRNIFERWKNVKDIFETIDSQTLEGKHIAIVDDVITSGSTICACAETLQKIPNTKISVFALAATI